MEIHLGELPTFGYVLRSEQHTNTQTNCTCIFFRSISPCPGVMKHLNGSANIGWSNKRRFDFDQNAACSGLTRRQIFSTSPPATVGHHNFFFELVSCHHRIHTRCRPHFLVTAHCRLRSIISTHTGVVSDMLPICLIQGKELTCAQMHFRYLLIISIIAYCNSSWTISQVHAFTRKTYTHLIASPFKHN